MESKQTGREIIQNRSKYISQEEYNSLTVGKNLYEGVIDLRVGDNKTKLYQKKKLITLKELDVNNRNKQTLNPKISSEEYEKLTENEKKLYTIGFGTAGKIIHRLIEKKNNSPKNTGSNSKISLKQFRDLLDSEKKLYTKNFNEQGTIFYKKK